MPLSKTEIEKRRNKAVTKRFINVQAQVMKDLEIPMEYINRCKVRARLQCKTEEEAIILFSRMKIDYLLGERWEP